MIMQTTKPSVRAAAVQNCFLGLVAGIVRDAGGELSEVESFAVAGGYGYRFGTWTVPSASALGFTTFDPDVDMMRLRDGLAGIGVSVERRLAVSPAELLVALGSVSDSAAGVIVYVDSGYLTYWPEAERKHEWHFLRIRSWNPAGDSWVEDVLVPGAVPSSFNGPLPTADLERALFSRDVQVGHGLYPLWTVSVPAPAVVRRARPEERLASSQLCLLDTDLQGPVVHELGNSRFEHYVGIAALEELWRAALRGAALSGEAGMRLYQQIVTFGGPLSSLDLYAHWLREYPGFLGIDPSVQVLSHAMDLSAAWRRASVSLFRQLHGSGGHNATFADRMTDVIELERRHIDLLKEVLR